MKFCIFAAVLFLPLVPAHASSVVDEFDPEVLRQLDQPGEYSLATVLGAAEAEQAFLEEKKGDPQLARLKVLRLSRFASIGNSKFNSLAERINQDVADLKSLSGEKMAFSSEQAELLAPQGNVARHFDPFWLNSARAGFPLVAVVNRLDKRDTNSGTCGELRFIYRLAYFKADAKSEGRSTLPVFFNVVFDYSAEGGCKETALGWQFSAKASGVDARVQALKSGPLAKARFHFKQLELNMQIVRFPSGQKIDFGGQAIYLFRIFREQSGRLVPIPLENTPDVAEIRKSKTLKDALLRQISDRATLEKIDNGTFVLENSEGKLLATRALSFSTTGRARLANKPFTAIFGADAPELESVDRSGLRLLRSRQALLERLDNHSCVGCHQSGGTAGFHLLGLTGDLNSAFNQVVLPFSPHYYAERVRREAYVGAMASGAAPNTFHPPSFFPAARWAAEGKLPDFEKARVRALCLPDNKDFSAGYGCENGAECKLSVLNKSVALAIGECVARPNNIAGHACRTGVIASADFDYSLGDLFNLKSFRDSIDIERTYMDGGLACGNPKGGVPLGRISKPCEADSSAGRLEFVDGLSPGDAPPKEICAMRGGPQFDECAIAPNPPDCLANAKIVRSLLDSCSMGRFCREDYICQQLPADVSRLYNGAEKAKVEARLRKLGELGIGFCVPNYFVFNMRSDGHIIPETRH